MSESKIEHLKMVQVVISRMAQNSFRIKGWATVLLAALLGLAASSSNSRVALVAIVPLGMLWSLDSYYLRQERLFRALYDAVRGDAENEADFSLDTKAFVGEVESLFAVFCSTTVISFHGTLLVVTMVVSCMLGEP